MNEFTALRARAREQRDKAIAQAKQNYAEALERIAVLENSLLERDKPKVRRTSDCISRVLPTDKPFTVDDILEALEAHDPSRVWSKKAVCNHITNLRKRGIVYRVRKPKLGVSAIYARKGVSVAPSKLGDKSLVEVMRSILKSPMTAMELTVAVLEAGYETSMSRQDLRGTIRRELGKGKFTRDGERWRVG